MSQAPSTEILPGLFVKLPPTPDGGVPVPLFPGDTAPETKVSTQTSGRFDEFKRNFIGPSPEFIRAIGNIDAKQASDIRHARAMSLESRNSGFAMTFKKSAAFGEMINATGRGLIAHIFEQIPHAERGSVEGDIINDIIDGFRESEQMARDHAEELTTDVARARTRAATSDTETALVVGELGGMLVDPVIIAPFVMSGGVANLAVEGLTIALERIGVSKIAPKLFNLVPRLAFKGGVTGGGGFGATNIIHKIGANADKQEIYDSTIEAVEVGVPVGMVFEFILGGPFALAKVISESNARSVLNVASRGRLASNEVNAAYRTALDAIDPTSKSAKEELTKAAYAYQVLAKSSSKFKPTSSDDIVNAIDDIEQIGHKTLTLNDAIHGEKPTIGGAKSVVEPKPEVSPAKEPTILDSVVKSAEDRMAARRRPSAVQGKGKPKGTRGGSAPIAGDIKDAAIIIAAKSSQAILKGGKEIAKVVAEFVKNDVRFAGHEEKLIKRLNQTRKDVFNDLRKGGRAKRVKPEDDPFNDLFAELGRVVEGETTPHKLIKTVQEISENDRTARTSDPKLSELDGAKSVFKSSATRAKRSLNELAPGVKDYVKLSLHYMKARKLTPAELRLSENRLNRFLEQENPPVDVQSLVDGGHLDIAKGGRKDMLPADVRKMADSLDVAVDMSEFVNGRSTPKTPANGRTGLNGQIHRRINEKNDIQITDEASKQGIFKRRKTDKRTGGLVQTSGRDIRDSPFGSSESADAAAAGDIIGGSESSLAAKIIYTDLFMGKRAALKGYYEDMDSLYAFLETVGIRKNSDQLSEMSFAVATERNTLLSKLGGKVRRTVPFLKDVQPIVTESVFENGTLRMTGMERVYLIASLKAEANKKQILAHGVKMKGDAKGDSPLMLTEADASVFLETASAQETQIADFLLEMLNTTVSEKFARFHTYAKGTDGLIDGEYFFLKRTGFKDTNEITEILSDDPFKLVLDSISIAQKRTINSEAPVVIGDAIESMQFHLWIVNHLSETAEPIERLGHLTGQTLLSNLIKDSKHPEWVNNLKMITEKSAADAMGRNQVFGGAFRNLVSNFVKANLTLNPTVMLYQPLSVFNLMNEFNPKDVIAEFTRSIPTKRLSIENARIDSEMDTFSAMSRHRSNQSGITMVDATDTRTGGSLHSEAGIKDSFDGFQSGISAADRIPFRALWRLSKAKVNRINEVRITEGKEPLRGNDYWDAVALIHDKAGARTQPMFDVLHRSMNSFLAQEDPSRRASIGLFRSFLDAQNRQLRRAGRHALRDGKLLKAQKEAGAAKPILSEIRRSQNMNLLRLANIAIVNSTLSYMVASHTRWALSGFDPEKKPRLTDLAWGALTNAAGMFVGGEYIVGTGRQMITKEAPNFDPDIFPFARSVELMIVQMGRWTRSDYDKFGTNLERVIEAGLQISGNPFTVPLRLIRQLYESLRDRALIDP